MQTRSLRLVPLTREDALVMIGGMSAADRTQLSADWLARLHASSPQDPWIHGFSVVHETTGDAIGTCGFKGPPTDDGVVEIAYGIDARQRGKGYATEAAEALVQFAFTSPRVRLVRAHTLAEADASSRVLTKCGFRHVGNVVDPDDGVVCRWERHREPI